VCADAGRKVIRDMDAETTNSEVFRELVGKLDLISDMLASVTDKVEMLTNTLKEEERKPRRQRNDVQVR
jgi:hypothetical protein